MLVSLFKELNLASLPKRLLNKVLFILLLASSSMAQALTLGDFVVDSFLDKPLKAEIVVNGNSGDNLNTLEISMASKEEFKQAGIARSPALDSFNFKLVKNSKSSAKILVLTDDKISDPYIHMLLKVRWNGGQLLREFTALIDPPLYSSQPADKVDAAKTGQPKTTVPSKELNVVDEDTKKAVSPSALAPTSNTGSLSADTYGPVQAGESLSLIAQKIQQDNPDLSIYQIMYVLFQNNESAFIDKNINGLAKGSTLQIGDLSAGVQVDKKESVNFFYSQLAQWSAKQEPQTGASNGDVKISPSDNQSSSGESNSEASNSPEATQETPSSNSSEPEIESSDSGSKPEFQVASSDVQSGTQQSGEVSNQVVTDLKTQVSELEASVESSKLESEELKETISILESQLADSNRLIELTNQELANLATGDVKELENEALLVTTPEVEAEQAVVDETTKEEAEIVEEEAKAAEAAEEEAKAAEEEAKAAEEEAKAAEEEAKAAEEEAKAAEEEAKAVSEPEPVSFLDGIIAKIKEFWLYMAIALAGLLVLILLKMRSSKKEEDIDVFESTFTVYPENTADMDEDNTSDAKAEELINAIKAETARPANEEAVANTAINDEEISTDTSVVSSIDMDALREATQSVTDFEVDSAESGEITKESSFLTVYNDGDVVMNADEIDPIAEADVYIAYGREDQGEEVLLDGVKNFPDRNDIKIALLGLYVKGSKRQKFDDIYQGLVNKGIENNIEEWQSVEELKALMDAKSGGSTPDNNEMPLAPVSEPLRVKDLGLTEELSNTDFIVNSDVNDLSEIDIKSESFDISEIDFSADIDDVPVLNGEIDQDSSIDIDDLSLDGEITLEIESDLDLGQEDDIESVSIQIDEMPDAAVVDDTMVDVELDGLVGSLDDVDFTTDIDLDDGKEVAKGNDISEIEREISEVNFSDDMIASENSIQIDLDESITLDEVDAVDLDIGAEISEVSYNDEVSLTDVMDLNVDDIDLANIPNEQDLTPVKDLSAKTLVNDDVDFVNDMTIEDEVTVDLTEAMEFNNDDNEFGGIDLDLGGDDSSSNEVALPDGHNDPETQLDLAKVFLELDDVPGAVKILKQLVDNDTVGIEAKDLLAKNS